MVALVGAVSVAERAVERAFRCGCGCGVWVWVAPRLGLCDLASYTRTLDEETMTTRVREDIMIEVLKDFPDYVVAFPGRRRAAAGTGRHDGGRRRH